MIRNYLTIALRSLFNNRVFATLNIVGLGLSIGCCLLIFLLVRHHLTIDGFHRKIDRLGMVGTETRQEEISKDNNVPMPMAAALRAEYAFLEKTSAYSIRFNSLVTIRQDGQAPVKFQEEDVRAFTEPEFFEMFDFPLAQGSFKEFDQPNTALLTERLAEKYFGSADAAMGKMLNVNNYIDYRVIGVLKNLPENSDIKQGFFTSVATLTADSNGLRSFNNWGGINGGTHCFVLLREGHSISELENALAGLREKYFHPEVREWFYHAIPMAAAHFDSDYGFGMSKRQLWVLVLIGLFLLGTACVNFVNMATAQALNRAREVGVRKTMGSTRGQLFWQFMAETGVIVLVSMGIGLALARFGLPFLNDLADTRLAFSLSKDLNLYGFMAALMVLVAFLAGAYPGVVLSGFRPAESLKGEMDARQAGGFSLRRLLVGSQFAISQALIIAAIVVTSQLEFAQNSDFGFRKDGIVTVPMPDGADEKGQTLKNELEKQTGIEMISLCGSAPASPDNWQTGLKLQSRNEWEPYAVNLKLIDAKYLEVFDLKLVAGRNLMPTDTAREYLINEALAEKLGFQSPDEAIGKVIDVNHSAFSVAGVVKDFHNQSFHEDIQPQVFTSEKRAYSMAAIRLDTRNLSTVLPAIEKTWKAIYPEYVYDLEFLDAQIAQFYEREQVILQLVQLFAGIAIFVGCLGLYGLAAFMVSRKRKEVGIRKTLGASIAGILWLFGREYSRLIVVAFLVAAPLTWWAMNRWLEDFAYRISIGAGVFLLSLLTTFCICILTVGFQSVRAALTNPVKSLRSE